MLSKLQFSTAQSDFLRKRLCNVVLLLKLKSRIFKDAPTFTVDAIEILPDDNGTTPEKTIIQCNTYSEQGLYKFNFFYYVLLSKNAKNSNVSLL